MRVYSSTLGQSLPEEPQLLALGEQPFSAELQGEDASLVLAAHSRVKSTIAAMAEAERSGHNPRSPAHIARELRVKPAAPTIPIGPALKKQKRQHSESKVHTIRVGEASIQESVRVAGGTRCTCFG